MAQEQPIIVFFDGQCRICQASRRWIERRRIDPSPRWVDSSRRENLALYPRIAYEQARGQLMVLAPNGRVKAGFDALVDLLGRMPAYRLVGPLASLPPLRQAGICVYRWVARNRYRFGGRMACDATGACRI